MRLHVVFNCFQAREKHLQSGLIGFFRLCHQVVGFGRQAAGVEREDLDRQAFAQNDVGQHHIFRAEAVGKSHLLLVAEFFYCISKQLQHTLAFAPDSGLQGVRQLRRSGRVGSSRAQQGDFSVHCAPLEKRLHTGLDSSTAP